MEKHCIVYRVEDLNGNMLDDFETLEQAKNYKKGSFQIREIYVSNNENEEDIDGEIIYKQI